VHADQREVDERFRMIVGPLNPTGVATDGQWVDPPPHASTQSPPTDPMPARLGALLGAGTAIVVLVVGAVAAARADASTASLASGLVVWLLLVLPGTALLGAALASRGSPRRPSS
jgi:hypothetical protein